MGLRLPATRGSRPRSASPRIGDAAFNADPHPYFARLRALGPVHRIERFLGQPAWLVVHYDEAAMILKDVRFGKAAANAMSARQLAAQPWFRKVQLFKSVQQNMLNQDPPVHTRLRALVSKAFTPPLVEQMRGRVQSLADGLLDRARNDRHFELIRDFALPLPATVIAEMLGVPREDRRRFHRWSNALIAISSNWGMVKALANAWLFMRYVRGLIAERRRRPQDDLISALVRVENEGDVLSGDELVAMIMVLLVAGHETTANLIGSGGLALLQHPDQRNILQCEPGLIRPAVEELLRYTCPLGIATERYAREDVSIGGVTIPRGELVGVVLASANRDERHFQDPDRLDIAREPNRHLSFGLGAHFCLGASLARMEAQIAIETLFRRLPGLRLGAPIHELRWRRGALLRGLEALPLEIE